MSDQRIKVHILFREDATEDDIESFIPRFNMYCVQWKRKTRIFSATVLKEDFEMLQAIPLIDSIVEDEPGMDELIEEIQRLKSQGKEEEIARILTAIEPLI